MTVAVLVVLAAMVLGLVATFWPRRPSKPEIAISADWRPTDRRQVEDQQRASRVRASASGASAKSEALGREPRVRASASAASAKSEALGREPRVRASASAASAKSEALGSEVNRHGHF